MLVLTASNNFSRFSKLTQFASITAQDLPLRTALIVRSGNLLAKWYNTQLSGEIRKAKLIKYENDVPCVTYRSCELQRDNEPFEKFRGGAFRIAVAFTSRSAIFRVRGKISDRGDVFRVPLLHGALMKDRYPTEGAAILGTVLYTELIGRVAQDR